MISQAVADQTEIGRNRGHLEAVVDSQPCTRPIPTVQPRANPGCPAGGHDRVESGREGRRIGVATGEHLGDIGGWLASQAETKISWSDVQSVDALDGGDRVDFIDCAGRLHLDHHIWPLVERPSPSGLHAERSSAGGGVAGGVDCPGCIVGRFDQWNNDAGSSEVECAADAPQIDRLHPNQTGHFVVSHQCEETGVDSREVDTMLGIDTNEIRLG